MPLLFTVTLFLSASLLFMVQPMVGKMVLPLLGGSPAVWSTCMVFFQVALLGGYAYAHASTAWLGVRRQSIVHLGVLALPLIALPLGIDPTIMRVLYVGLALVTGGAALLAYPVLWVIMPEEPLA